MPQVTTQQDLLTDMFKWILVNRELFLTLQLKVCNSKFIYLSKSFYNSLGTAFNQRSTHAATKIKLSIRYFQIFLSEDIYLPIYLLLLQIRKYINSVKNVLEPTGIIILNESYKYLSPSKKIINIFPGFCFCFFCILGLYSTTISYEY